MMWLFKVISKLFGSTKRVHPETMTSLTERRRCEIALKSLGLPDPIEISVYSAQGVRVFPEYANVEHYTKQLRLFEAMVRKNVPIKVLNTNGPLAGIDLDLFLVSDDNCYIDKFDSIVHFHLAATLLCESLEKIEGAQYGVAEHNTRVLGNILQDVAGICMGINQARTIN